MMAALAESILFPKTEAIPQSLAIAFLRMMMAHARFDLEVRLLQSSVAIGPRKQRRCSSKLDFGERPRNQMEGRRPRQIYEEADRKKARRNSGDTWWKFDSRTATIAVRGGIQRKGEKQFAYYTEMCIRAIAEKFETLEAELYKLRSKIEDRRGDHDIDE